MSLLAGRMALSIIAYEYMPELQSMRAERRALIRETERVLDEYAQRMGL